MAEAMAPPAKRRKLASSSSESIHQDNSTPTDILPSYPQAIDRTPRPCELSSHTHKHHSMEPVEEPHHDVKRDIGEEVGDAAALQPRLDVDVAANGLPITLPALSIQIFTDATTTLTYTPPALPTLPTLPSVPGATTFSNVPSTTSTPSSSFPSSYPNATNHSSISSSVSLNFTTSATSSLTTSAVMFVGRNSTATSHSTITITTETTSTLYYATLDNGAVSTITKSSSAFTTTLEGEVFTVPGYSNSPSRLQVPAGPTAATTTTTGYSGADGAPVYGTATTTSSTSTSTSDSGGGGSSPPAGVIAGGVVGGAAGLAVVVLIAMLFVRWYRKKGQSGHQALPQASGYDEQSRSGPGMAERAGVIPFAAAVPALFRHHRDAEPEQSERGFTRISGRKLPSQWSEGMRSNIHPDMPQAARSPDMSQSPFHRDSRVFSDGSGGDLSPGSASPDSMDLGPLRTSDPGTMIMWPGPERLPQVYHGSPSLSIPGQSNAFASPSAPMASASRRSVTPSSILDPNRSSRFTEDM